MTVPASMIPESAFGIAARDFADEEIWEQDPFGGAGLRLRVLDGRILTPADVRDALGAVRCAVSVASVWIHLDDNADERREGVRRAWEGWLARDPD
jgi:hypothetical protein